MSYPRDYVACGGEPHDDMQSTDSAAASALIHDHPDAAAAERTAMERPGLAEALAAARKTRAGRLPSANFPPFVTLPGDSARSMKRGEPLEVIAARPASGRSLMVQDLAQLEAHIGAQMIQAAAQDAATYCGVPIIENKFLPPDTVYIVTDAASTASLIAALSDVLPLMGKKP